MFIAPNPASTSFQVADTLRILVACFFILIALSSIWRWTKVKEDFKRWRLPQGFKLPLILWQVLSALLLLNQQTTLFACLSLIFMMNGAFFIHLKFDSTKDCLSPLIVMLLSAFIAWNFKIESYESLTSKAAISNIQSCIACHSNKDLAPKLESLNYDYLWDQVKNFQEARRGSKKDTAQAQAMALAVKDITDDDLRNILAYYARTKTKDLSTNKHQPLQIYQDSCAGCHSSPLRRMVTQSPKLEGQSSEYIAEQLHKFKDGRRQSSNRTKHQ